MERTGKSGTEVKREIKAANLSWGRLERCRAVSHLATMLPGGPETILPVTRVCKDVEALVEYAGDALIKHFVLTDDDFCAQQDTWDAYLDSKVAVGWLGEGVIGVTEDRAAGQSMLVIATVPPAEGMVGALFTLAIGEKRIGVTEMMELMAQRQSASELWDDIRGGGGAAADTGRGGGEFWGAGGGGAAGRRPEVELVANLIRESKRAAISAAIAHLSSLVTPSELMEVERYLRGL